MDYAKSEEISNSVHNRNFNSYINQHLNVIILVYRYVFSNCYRRANNMLIGLLNLSMISVGTNSFDGAKEKSAWQILIFP